MYWKNGVRRYGHGLLPEMREADPYDIPNLTFVFAFCFLLFTFYFLLFTFYFLPFLLLLVLFSKACQRVWSFAVNGVSIF